MLNVGDKAPDFTLPDQDENPISLSSYKNQKVIICIEGKLFIQ